MWGGGGDVVRRAGCRSLAARPGAVARGTQQHLAQLAQKGRAVLGRPQPSLLHLPPPPPRQSKRSFWKLVKLASWYETSNHFLINMIRAPQAWPRGTGNAANRHRQISGRAKYLNCHPTAELLGSFEEDLRFLTATELHPALRREGCRRLVDLVNAEQLRELWAGCSRSHRHFATKVRAWGFVVWKWLVAGGEGGWEGEGLGPHRPVRTSRGQAQAPPKGASAVMSRGSPRLEH